MRHRDMRRRLALAATFLLLGGGVLVAVAATDGPGPEYLASLVRVEYHGPRQTFICSGTLVARDVVLTAAHCTEAAHGEAARAGDYTVIANTPRGRNRFSEATGVEGFVRYPRWDPATGAGDAAALLLDAGLHAPRMRLATNVPRPGTAVVLAGYGLRLPGSEGGEYAASGPMTVLDARACSHEEPAFRPAHEICALDRSHHRTSACYGASGGPLLTIAGRLELAVTVRVESPRCNPDAPSYFTSSALIGRWLKLVIAAAAGGAR